MATKKNPPAVAQELKFVAGVKLQFVNLTELNKALADSGIKVDAKTTIEKRVELLAQHELEACKEDKNLPEDQRLGGECSICGGLSLLSRPACPFCGTAEEQPAPIAPVANPPPKSAKAAKAAKANKSKDKPTEETKALAKVADAGKLAKTRAADIATREKRIGALVRDGLVNAWKIGREMLPVYKDGLWKFHLDADGKPRFKSFGEWVSEVFKVQPQTARNMIIVAANFTEAKVRELGVEKLSIALRVPAEMQAEVLEKAGELSSRELEAEVKRIAPGSTRKPIERNDSLARPGVAAANARRARENAERPRPSRALAPNEVTAVFALQRYEVPMFARAKSAESGDPLRAKNLAADPHAVLALSNGVELHLRWVEEEEGLVSVVEFKRIAEAAAE